MYERTYHTKVLKQSHPSNRKVRRPFRWKRFFLLLCMLGGAGTLVVLMRLPHLQIQTIEVFGTTVTDPEEVSQFVREQISGTYLFIFPRSSMLLVPTTTLSKKISRAFPRFFEVTVRRKGGNDLSVTVVEHTGAYLWCTTEEGHCYFMNADGLVYADAPVFSGDAYVKLFGGGEGKLPFRPLSDAQRSLVPFFIDRLQALDIKPVSFDFVSDREYVIAYQHDGYTVELFLDPTNDPEASLEALYTAFRTQSFASQYRHKQLTYVDLRFPNKVVYKFNKEDVTTPSH